MKLDVGCGNEKIEGSIGIDAVSLPNVDVVHNLNVYPWPFSDNTFEEVYCFHVLEHLDDIIAAMQEIFRICRNNATVFIKVPHASCSRVVWGDPTHKRGFTCRTFSDYFSRGSKYYYYSNVDFVVEKQKMNYCLYDGKRDTRIPRFWQLLNNFLANISPLSQEAFERLFANWVGGFEELDIVLKVRK